jgi:hypothetical protein
LPHDDPFPIELLGRQAQESLLHEFGGRRPSIAEVANIPEADLLKLPGIGLSTVRKVRLLAQNGTASSFSVAGLSDDDLLLEHDRLSAELSDLRNEFNRRERELRAMLSAVRHELRMRGHSLKRGT